MSIELQNKEEFAEKFLGHFLANGFGTMPKREIEILVYHLLMEYADLGSKTEYEKSIALKISPARVKSLDYEKMLKYAAVDADGYIRQMLPRLFQNASLKIDRSSQWIMFSVENSFTREALKAKLKQLGHFGDTSFNREILKVDKEAFLSLIDFCYGNEEIKVKKELLRELDAKTKEMVTAEGKITARVLFSKFLDVAIGKAGEIAFDRLLSSLTGGITDIPIILKHLSGLLK